MLELEPKGKSHPGDISCWCRQCRHHYIDECVKYDCKCCPYFDEYYASVNTNGNK